jgi:hypothetical protein
LRQPLKRIGEWTIEIKRSDTAQGVRAGLFRRRAGVRRAG